MTENLTPLAVVSLLAAAEGNEARAIMAAAVRADMMWRCKCRQVNYLGFECARCGEPQPKGAT